MLNIKETYVTVVDNRQVVKTTDKNGQATIYGSATSNHRPQPYRKIKLQKEKEK